MNPNGTHHHSLLDHDADQLDFSQAYRPPQIVIDGDKARTRRSDPAESHAAADRSQHTISALRLAVLALVREEPISVGSALNEMYRARYERRGWPKCAWDSPRKRAGELADDGLLLIAGSRDGERTFIISSSGLDVIAPKGNQS